jgi:hypothetical protein
MPAEIDWSVIAWWLLVAGITLAILFAVRHTQGPTPRI